MLCILHYDKNGTTFRRAGTQYAYHILVANFFQKAEKVGKTEIFSGLFWYKVTILGLN